MFLFVDIAAVIFLKACFRQPEKYQFPSIFLFEANLFLLYLFFKAQLSTLEIVNFFVVSELLQYANTTK